MWIIDLFPDSMNQRLKYIILFFLITQLLALMLWVLISFKQGLEGKRDEIEKEIKENEENIQKANNDKDLNKVEQFINKDSYFNFYIKS